MKETALDSWIKLNQAVKVEYYIGTKALKAIDEVMRKPPPKEIPKAKSSSKGAKPNGA